MKEYKRGIVSVIIPTYNRSEELSRAIESVKKQYYKKIEIVVVDDGSTDDTAEKYACCEDVIFIANKKRMGACYARNYGARVASGEYIAFLDSDNEWFPDKTSRQLECIQKGFDFVFCCFYNIKSGNKQIAPVKNIINNNCKESIIETLKWENVVDTSTILVKHSVFEAVGGFDETLPAFEDYDLAIRLAKYTDPYFLEEVLVNRYYSKNSISNNTKAKLQTSLRIFDKNVELWNEREQSDFFKQMINKCKIWGEDPKNVKDNGYISHITLKKWLNFVESIADSISLSESSFRHIEPYAIYGSGTFARGLYRKIIYTHDNCFMGFVISDSKEKNDLNPMELSDFVRNYGVDSVEIVIAAVSKRDQMEIKEALRNVGYNNYRVAKGLLEI